MRQPKRSNPPGATAGYGTSLDHRGQRHSEYNTPRRLPPFAREIIAGKRFAGTSADASRHSIWLVIGPHAWNHAKALREQEKAVTLVSPGEDPNAFRWDFLAGHEPILLVKAGEVQGHATRALVEAVIGDGVGRVLDLGTMDRYVRGDTCRT